MQVRPRPWPNPWQSGRDLDGPNPNGTSRCRAEPVSGPQGPKQRRPKTVYGPVTAAFWVGLVYLWWQITEQSRTIAKISRTKFFAANINIEMLSAREVCPQNLYTCRMLHGNVCLANFVLWANKFVRAPNVAIAMVMFARRTILFERFS